MLVAATIAAMTVVGLRSAGPSGEWRNYAADKASTRYSPADQINRDNVRNLKVAWRQSATPEQAKQGRANAPAPPGNNEATPLMVGGLVYYSTGLGTVAALDAATGRVVWVDIPPPAANDAASKDTTPGGDGTARARGTSPGGAGGDRAGFVGQSRSVAYWTDGRDERILAMTGPYLVALNARTGKRYPGFGNGGQLDLRRGLERGGESFSWRTGPTGIVRDVLIVGMNVDDINNAARPSTKEMPPGDVRGIDVRTGRQLWLWHAIPHPGEVGNRPGRV